MRGGELAPFWRSGVGFDRLFDLMEETLRIRRAFRRRFNLADYVEVTGACFGNGLLQIDLVREMPEAMKPRRIEIKSGAGHDQPQIEHKQAA